MLLIHLPNQPIQLSSFFRITDACDNYAVIMRRLINNLFSNIFCRTLSKKSLEGNLTFVRLLCYKTCFNRD